jgi:transcription antitermination protein NusB
MASRHLSRSIALQSLYEWDFYGKKPDTLNNIVEKNIKEFAAGLDDLEFIRTLARGVEQSIQQLDELIVKTAPDWPLEQINMLDRNVLRLGLYELLYANKEEVPPKVAINEAIELAKVFGGESSGRFVNGVMGTVYSQLQQKEEKSEKENDQ